MPQLKNLSCEELLWSTNFWEKLNPQNKVKQKAKYEEKRKERKKRKMQRKKKRRKGGRKKEVRKTKRQTDRQMGLKSFESFLFFKDKLYIRSSSQVPRPRNCVYDTFHSHGSLI